MTDPDPVLRAVGKALWDAYGYTLPDAPEVVAWVAVDAMRQVTACETPHPGGEATEGGAFEGYRP